MWRLQSDGNGVLFANPTHSFSIDNNDFSDSIIALKTITHILPAAWASYLVNNDSSGISGEEISDCDFFCVTHGLTDKCADCSKPYFLERNDFEVKAGDVCKYTFLA